jgi:hypothetical protein
MDRRLLFGLLLGLAGCLNEKENEAMVSPNPFAGPPVVTRTQTTFPQANLDTAARVDQVGRQILASNPQIGMRPFFCAIGSQTEEVFHQGTGKLVITEGLVKRCKTDAELAAVLSRELGKMVSEREALATPAMRQPQRRPPIQVEVGRDVGGLMRTDDGTELYELAKFEKETGMGHPIILPPDPIVLARKYLKQAGFPEAALDEASPIFKAADKNSAWERQMNSAPARPFTN